MIYPLYVLQDPEATVTANDTISTMTAPEAQDDVSTISASEVAQLETGRQPPGTINPSAEEARINTGNLDLMKAHVSRMCFTFNIIPEFQYNILNSSPKSCDTLKTRSNKSPEVMMELMNFASWC